VYTNGSVVYRLAPGGERSEICTARLIERVVCLQNQAGGGNVG
jgi:hypothetical protein